MQLLVEADAQRQTEVTNLKWRIDREKRRSRASEDARKRAFADWKQAEAELKVEQMQRMIDFEKMPKQVQELLAEASAAATSEAHCQVNEALQNCTRVRTEQQSAKLARIKELERAVINAEGDFHRLEASVEALLDDQAGKLEELFKETEESMAARHAEDDKLMRRQHAAELKKLQNEKQAAEAAKARAEFAAAKKIGEAATVVKDALLKASKSSNRADAAAEKLRIAEVDLAELATMLEALRSESHTQDRRQ